MKQDMTGRTYGRWTVVSFSHTKKPHDYYNCRCECGTERVVQAPSLRSGTSVSCGCYRVDINRDLHWKHGAVKHPAYQSWTAMRRRCEDPEFIRYKDYGGRGISFCEEWREFSGFWNDMGPTWRPGLTLERKDVNGNYTPSNCTWVTRFEQGQNKRNTVWIETPWGKLPQTEAARRGGIHLMTLRQRIKAGWPPETWFLPSARSPRIT